MKFGGNLLSNKPYWPSCRHKRRVLSAWWSFRHLCFLKLGLQIFPYSTRLPECLLSDQDLVTMTSCQNMIWESCCSTPKPASTELSERKIGRILLWKVHCLWKIWCQLRYIGKSWFQNRRAWRSWSRNTSSEAIFWRLFFYRNTLVLETHLWRTWVCEDEL